MSWSLFKTQCNVLTGNPHVTTQLFASTIANAYHSCMSLHFDSMTGGGVLTNNAPKLPILEQSILQFCELNRQTTADVDLLQQIGPSFILYHTGLLWVGPTGTNLTVSPGQWSNVKTPPNTNFQIILTNLEMACRTHLMTITGTYTSSIIPGVTAPSSGAAFLCLP